MGASFIYTVQPRFEKRQRSPADTVKAWAHLPCFKYDGFEQLISCLPHACPIVAVEMGGEPLETFRHPARAIYLLGSEDMGLPPDVTKKCHFQVALPTVRSASMNVAACGSILLYDRLLKRTILDPPLDFSNKSARPRQRLAAAIAGKKKQAAFDEAKQRHFTAVSGREVQVDAALCRPLHAVVGLLDDSALPFYVVAATPPQITRMPSGGVAFRPAMLRVRCLDLRAAHSLIKLTGSGRCCDAFAASLDERKVAVVLRTRRPEVELHGAAAAAVAGVVEGSEASSAGMDEEEGLLRRRLREAEEELEELAARLRRARPGWATGLGSDPLQGSVSLDWAEDGGA